jgi:hypothetical protein
MEHESKEAPLNRFRFAALPLAVVALLAVASPCLAQDPGAPGNEPAAVPPLDDTDLTFSVAAGYQFLFRTDLDAGGSYSVDRVGLEFKAKTKIGQDWRVEGNFRYLFNDYDFNNAVGLGGDPWSDIHTVQMDVRLEWWATNDIVVIFGPFLMWSRESGASWEDALSGGAFAGVMYVKSSKLAFGAGVGISSQLEDSVLVYPLLFLDWKFSGNMKLTSVAGPVGLAFTGIEWVWDFADHFQFGVGARYEFRRFRLDNSGFAPGGVGEDTSVPFWGRLSYRFNDNFAADLYAGFVAGGKFKVDDSNGNRLGQDDSELAPTLAIAFRLTF